MKVAYLFHPGRATIKAPVSGTVYSFDPWCENVDPRDWPFLKEKGYMAGCNCKGKTREWMPAFGADQEIRDGLKGFSR